MKVRFQKDHVLVISPRLVYLCGIYSGTPKLTKAAAFFPVIAIRSEDVLEPWLIQHERIHFRQQIETLFIGLVFLSFFETMYALLVLKKSLPEAYLWRSSEQEAYRNQLDEDYLQKRPPWALLRYIQNKKSFTLGSRGEVLYIV